jgi:hypothetical protein
MVKGEAGTETKYARVGLCISPLNLQLSSFYLSSCSIFEGGSYLACREATNLEANVAAKTDKMLRYESKKALQLTIRRRINNFHYLQRIYFWATS